MLKHIELRMCRLKIVGSFGEITVWSTAPMDSKYPLAYEEITENEAAERGIPLANYGICDADPLMSEGDVDVSKLGEAFAQAFGQMFDQLKHRRESL